MALQDDDKKFIKETVSEEISSELDNRDIKKTKDTDGVDNVYKKNQENIEDRLAYLAERTLAGESTMAEKFELMKTAMKEAIPEDLKNVTSAVGQTFGKGGKQLAKGLSDLTGTVAKLTPLTAMLWESRHIFGNILGGITQMGWGAIKGGLGAAGTVLNAATNFGIKKISQKFSG